MSLIVETHQISATDASNRYFVLMDGTPASPFSVAMDVVTGTAQSMNGDFGVDGAIIRWDSTDYGLYGEIYEDLVVRVMYDRS